MSELLAEAVSSVLPIGMIIPYSGLVDVGSAAVLKEAGWLLCDGRAIGRIEYARLFKVIGDIHGRGDAVSTFNLPDYRGYFLRGVDGEAGRDPEANVRTPAKPGGLSGNAVGSTQGDAFRSHQHDYVQMLYNNDVDGVDSALTHSYEHRNGPAMTSVVGGKETRPLNAYVYWLILAQPK